MRMSYKKSWNELYKKLNEEYKEYLELSRNCKDKDTKSYLCGFRDGLQAAIGMMIIQEKERGKE